MIMKNSDLRKQITYRLPNDLDEAVKASIDDWRQKNKVRKLWARDASLWTGSDESNWMGWLGIVEEQSAQLDQLLKIAAETKASGFEHLLLLGMGGSSLCPEVWKMTFGKIPGYPELHVLDSTDPAQIQAFESKLNLARTLCIVSSKSGGTLEPNIFKQYFFDRIKRTIGTQEAGSRFVAITDPGSQLHKMAESERFRHLIFGVPSIGGRYSALSNFGLAPAAMMGLDVKKILDRATAMVRACAADVSADQNPGVLLGIILGVLAMKGRDKLTILTSAGIWDLGAWLEQLIAESTGKEGKGIIPVDQEKLGPPEVYGSDRLFVHLRLGSESNAEHDAALARLEEAGQPVVRLSISDRYDLGQEFFRWEIATAVASSILGINPFNQPDVEQSKVATKKLTSAYEQTGSLPAEAPLFSGDGLQLYSAGANAWTRTERREPSSLVGYLASFFRQCKAGDYVAWLAYIEMNAAHEKVLQSVRHRVRDRKRSATCVGFGPRFLHSTGQAYKGGPNSGLFLQITSDPAKDLAVPGQKFTFGIVKAAQARGDFQVLDERGRRLLCVHLGIDVEKGLEKLAHSIEQALV